MAALDLYGPTMRKKLLPWHLLEMDSRADLKAYVKVAKGCVGGVSIPIVSTCMY